MSYLCHPTISIEDRNNPVVKDRIEAFTTNLHRVLGDRARGIELDDDDGIPEFEPYEDDEMEQPVEVVETDELDYYEYHKFISARVSIPVGCELREGRHLRRATGFFCTVLSYLTLLTSTN
jgi:hypothetical protein